MPAFRILVRRPWLPKILVNLLSPTPAWSLWRRHPRLRSRISGLGLKPSLRFGRHPIRRILTRGSYCSKINSDLKALGRKFRQGFFYKHLRNFLATMFRFIPSVVRGGLLGWHEKSLLWFGHCWRLSIPEERDGRLWFWPQPLFETSGTSLFPHLQKKNPKH